MSRTKSVEPLFEINRGTKYFFFGIIIAIGVAIVLIHVILFISGDDKFIGTTSAVLLGASTCISLFIVITNPNNVEVPKFMLLFIGIGLWFLGEFTYTFYQVGLNIEAPYPGLGEIFYVAGYLPIILFTYRSFKTFNRNRIIKPKMIILVVTLASIPPVLSTIQIFTQEVDFVSQWPEILISTNNNYCDIILLSFSVLILTKIPKTNPYIYHWVLFTSFLILTTITDLIYLTTAIVDEEFLSQTVLIWEAMWTFSYLCILASLFWYYKLVRLLSENSAEYYSRLIEGSNYVKKYKNDNSVIKYNNDESLTDDDQLHIENIQDFNLVENKIEEMIYNTKDELSILFCNSDISKRKETRSILKFFESRVKSNVLVRVLFPQGVNINIIKRYREVASVRIFDRKIEHNNIIIASDCSKIMITSIADPSAYDDERAYFARYANNENIAYAQITTFEKLWLLQTVTKLEMR